LAGNEINWGNWVTPDLARNPGLASDVMKSSNPADTSTLVSHTVRGVAVQDAINDHADTNATQTFWSRLGNNTVTGLEWLGKPLKEVQKDYKFVHAVYTDHGFMPGFVATLGVIAGGVAGAAVAGPLGAAVGADISGSLLRKTMGKTYVDSYAKSEDDNYKVSAGRDFSNALATAAEKLGADGAAKAFRSTDKGLSTSGSALSAGVDLAADVIFDPLSIVGRFGQLMRGGKLLALDKAGELQLKYPSMSVIPGVKNFLTSQSRVALTADQIDAVRAGQGVFSSTARNYNAAIEDIAKSTAGEIAVKYPTLGTAAAGRLGTIDTADEVHQFLKTQLYFGELNGTLAGQAMLPQRTLLRAKFTEPLQDTLKVNKATSGVYKTFSGYMPYSVDPATTKLSLTKFRWNAPDAATVIYRIARFGMGDQAAKEMAGRYAEAVVTENLALARAIKNQTYFESLKAAGLPDDNQFVIKAFEEINKVSEPLTGTQIYATDPLGNPLGQYLSKNGLRNGGLVSHHASDIFDIPNFLEVRKALKEYGQLKKVYNAANEFTFGGAQKVLYGKNDEFLLTRYTNKIFKPLALATAGFGLRVAAAELIPTFARFGIINTFKAKLAISAAKANYDLSSNEAKHIFPAAMSALGIHMGIAPDVLQEGFPAFKLAKAKGLNFAAKMVPADQMELATRLILTNDGHIISEAVAPGHGYDTSTAYQSAQSAHYYYQIQKNSAMFRDLPEYTTYSPSDTHYVPRLTTTLNTASREAAHKNITQDLLNNFSGNKLQIEDDITKFKAHEDYKKLREQLIKSEYDRMVKTTTGQYKPYKDEMTTLTRWRDGDLYDFAADRVDATLGMIIGKDGTFHKNFAENIAAGRKTDLNEVVKMNETMQKSMPAAVSGPMMQPYIPTTTKLESIVNLGFKKVMDPIVTVLAREHLYLIHVADAYQQFLPRLAAGQMTEDQALRFAQSKASLAMLPQIHNTALRNQFAQIAANFLPFYFAQEQALKRAFNTLKDTSVLSPAFSRGLRFYQLAEHGLSDPAFMQTDDNGNKYIYLPGVGAFGEAVQNALASYGFPMVSGLPISAKGSMTSLKSVLPELQTPGVSPILAVSGNIISDIFPSADPIVKGTIGDISFKRGFLDTLIPAAWAKSVYSALTPDEQNKQLANAIASALAAAYYHGQVPGQDSNPTQRQEFIDRIKMNARSILLIKAMVGLTSPLAPQIAQEDVGLRDEFWKLVKQKGNYSDAMLEFLGTHGTSAVSYTVSRTEPNVIGAKYPYVKSTIDFINNNNDKFFGKDAPSTGYFFLIPQDNSGVKSDRAVFNELVGMHLRSQRTPAELLKQFYIAEGNQIIAADKKVHVDTIAAAKVNYDTYSQKQENDRWSAVMEKMKNLHPIWYADYMGGGEGAVNAQVAYKQLQQIFADPATAPKHEQAKLVKNLMNDYQTHSEIMNSYKLAGLQGAALTSEKQNWQNHLLTVEQQDPRLSAVINGVFMKLE